MAVTFTKIRSAAPAPVSELTFLGITGRMARWAAVSRQRRALGKLNGAMLRDIGLDAGEAQAEAARPFWDAPQGWR